MWETFWQREAADELLTVNAPYSIFLRHRFSFVEEMIEKHEPSSVLDAGCGSGLFDLMFAAHGCEVYLLDSSIEALNLARGIYTRLGFQNKMHLVRADACNMPFKDRSLDLVWNQGVLEHLHEPRNILMEMGRVATKSVIVIVPYGWNPLYRLSRLYCLILRKKWLWGGEIEKSYSARTLAMQCRNAKMDCKTRKLIAPPSLWCCRCVIGGDRLVKRAGSLFPIKGFEGEFNDYIGHIDKRYNSITGRIIKILSRLTCSYRDLIAICDISK